MEISPKLHTPIKWTDMNERIQQLFSIGDITKVDFAHGGYMSQNFRIESPSGVYFLKQYRDRVSTSVHEIKEAEAFFASKGLPIILPVRDRYDRGAFWVDGNWYSLFPFIEGKSPVFSEMDIPLIESIARLQAAFHTAGAKNTNRNFQHLRIGTRRKFRLESVEIEFILQNKKDRTELDEAILSLINRKRQIVESCPDSSALRAAQADDCLLHGDFQYFNFFTKGHEVTHVYDLERAALGPRAYELARSVFMNCFDDGWEEKNYAFARNFLQTYLSDCPMSKQEFVNGVKLYADNLVHTTWIEARYVIFGIQTQLAVFDRHRKRVDFATEDLDAFCTRIWPE